MCVCVLKIDFAKRYFVFREDPNKQSYLNEDFQLVEACLNLRD